jgi:hypothetical protein
MKLISITPNSIKKISNQELNSLHRRVHQLFGVSKKRQHLNKEYVRFLISVHAILIMEMNKRNLKHNTPL